MADSAFHYPLQGNRIFVAGHRGMVGSAIMRRLEQEDVILLTATRQELDLTRQMDVEAWFARHKPDAVILAAAKVGGILANASAPATFMHDNLAIATNVIETAHKTGVDRLLFLGSSCIYPKLAPQPINEDALMTGPLEISNEAYAIAKIAGLKMCAYYKQQFGRSYISAMPTNLYGPNDNFDLVSSHVLPALINKIHAAQETGAQSVTLWGSGTPKREFLHADDLADGLIHLLQHYDGEGPVNIGTGTDISILDLAKLIASIIGYEGTFDLDRSKPDGTPRKLLDVSRLAQEGWQAKIPLREGVASTYQWYLDNVVAADGVTTKVS
ncbi:MAG: GDP-L-fucose synthase [Pseudomonadota bacterium]